MKTCNYPGCNKTVFSKGYCKYHLYVLPSYRKKINKVSNKRKIEVKEYDKICRRLDAELIRDRGFLPCFFDLKPIFEKPDHHHVAGREGTSDNGVNLYLDPQGIVPCHPYCHRPEQNGYHSLTLQEIRQQSYFKRLLEKIKSVSLQQYTDWCIKLNLNPNEPFNNPSTEEF